MPRIPAPSSIRMPTPAAPSGRLIRAYQRSGERIGEEAAQALQVYDENAQKNEFVRLSGDLDRQLTDLRLEIEQDPTLKTARDASEAFLTRSKAIVDGTLGQSRYKSVQAGLAARASESVVSGSAASARIGYAREIDAAIADLDRNEGTYVSEFAHATTDDDRAAAIRKGTVSIDVSPFLSEREREARKARLLERSSLERAAVLSQADPASLARTISDESQFPGLSEAQRLKIKDAAEKEEKSRASKEIAEHVSDLDLRISRSLQTGEDLDVLEREVRKAFDEDMISGDGRTQRIRQIDSLRQKKESFEAGDAFVESVLSGAAYIDPKDRDHLAWLDSYYQRNVAPGLVTMAPDDRISAVASFSLRAGVMPKTLKGQIRGALRNGDIPSRAYASRVVGIIGEANPLLLDDFEKGDIAFAQLESSYARAGIPEAEAVQKTIEAFKAPQAEKDARALRYSEEQIADGNRRWLRDRMGEVETSEIPGVGILGSIAGALNLWDPDVEIPDLMAGEFDYLVEQLFTATGDVEAARKSALAALKRTWGVTTIGTRRWQKYAPEVVYANEAGSDWIKEQFMSDLASVPMVPEIKKGEEIRLEPDFLESRHQDPVYRAVMLDEYGNWGPLPLPPWQPDYATSPARKRLEEEMRERREKAIELAKKRREIFVGIREALSVREPSPQEPD